MYFVVYLEAIEKNVIVPAGWIDNIGEHLEKFINNGMNNNQFFLCYYTTKPEAFIGNIPDKDYEPDYFANFIEKVNADDSFDGWFFGQTVYFSRKFFF